MTTIWKYPLDLLDENILNIPDGGRVVHVGLQGTQICLWVLVDPDRTKEWRQFGIRGTGHPCPDSGYTGSVIQGAFVWHVFEIFQ